MAVRTRTPNMGLARLMAEAGWGNGQLARAVNRAGLESGLDLNYDESAVSHWLTGTLPRRQVRPVILEALSRKLGRPITSHEAGFGDDADALPQTDPVAAVMDLGQADMDPSRRSVLAAGMYSAALMVPDYTELSGRLEASRTGRTTHIGAGEVSTVRTMTDRIADILDELGGAHARPMAAAFLVNTVGPYLKASANERVRTDMLGAASDLVYLTGWMAMYEKAHGLGQQYYVQALNLAAAAKDHVTYCRTLRGMALQASNLGYGNKALQLADSASEAAPAAGPRLQAFLAGQQAHGAAMVKDRNQAFARLRETETALAKADSRRDAVGGYDESAYQFHTAHVLYELGDLPGSIKALQQSNRVRPTQERQGRVHANGLLAQRQLELGHVEAACATWQVFLDDYAFVSSARGDDHFQTMRISLRPYRQNRAARELDERARTVARQKA
ncbi:hypothetical protein [Streptacidiphilus sp. EB129]|uniref:hypothetical protein n=1 Tax=Streptacidiphilus sp. EB129 TaxID=3156262 RepID=UPI0035155A4F